jgi:hypothetical protein
MANFKLRGASHVEVAGEVKSKVFVPKKKRLLIGTIFIDDSAIQKKWLDLQLSFLQDTTEDFDHIVYLTKPSQSFEEVTNVVVGDGNTHVAGLRKLKEVFMENQDFYDYFLFIDSDAFPIQKGWMDILLERMDTFSKTHKKEIACNLRTENLEQRLHASVLFTKKDALNNLEWRINNNPIVDVMGNKEIDLQISYYQEEKRKLAFPMLRSNKVEVHPLLCGVYYNLFYHHGLGSGRGDNMRGKNYWNHLPLVGIDRLTDELMSDPREFIDKLVWS